MILLLLTNTPSRINVSLHVILKTMHAFPKPLLSNLQQIVLSSPSLFPVEVTYGSHGHKQGVLSAAAEQMYFKFSERDLTVLWDNCTPFPILSNNFINIFIFIFIYIAYLDSDYVNVHRYLCYYTLLLSQIKII